jgi:3-phytase
MTPKQIAALLAGMMSLLPAIGLAEVAKVPSILETPNLSEAEGDADADDPAFWVNPMDAAKTLVITAVKNGGMRVYDLAGAEVQSIGRIKTDAGKGRINNVDVVYGMTMADGSVIDVVVASDRGLDVLRVFQINADAEEPLTEITDLSVGRAFPTRPDPAGGADTENPLDDQMTIYGITGWKTADGAVMVAGTQRTNPRLGIFTLTPKDDGTVSATMVKDVRVPFNFRGQDLTAENEDDPLLDWNPQFEGLVADKVSGILYAGQEDVGIWQIDPVAESASAEPLVTTRGSAKSPFNATDGAISRDVEGLTVYYGETARYLLASSQGGAHGEVKAPDAPYDDSFVVFRIDDGFTLLGSFSVEASGSIDAVQESDGADVIATALPGFPNGLFVTQDGYNDDLNDLDGETAATNFKFVDWATIAGSFEPALDVNPSFDPRK